MRATVLVIFLWLVAVLGFCEQSRGQLVLIRCAVIEEFTCEELVEGDLVDYCWEIECEEDEAEDDVCPSDAKEGWHTPYTVHGFRDANFGESGDSNLGAGEAYVCGVYRECSGCFWFGSAMVCGTTEPPEYLDYYSFFRFELPSGPCLGGPAGP